MKCPYGKPRTITALSTSATKLKDENFKLSNKIKDRPNNNNNLQTTELCGRGGRGNQGKAEEVAEEVAEDAAGARDVAMRRNGLGRRSHQPKTKTRARRWTPRLTTGIIFWYTVTCWQPKR